MNAYILSDCLRVNGATGRILETGELARKLTSMSFLAPKGGYVSFQLIVETDGAEEVRLEAVGYDPARGVNVEFYVEWFHEIEDALVPDCLIPLGADGVARVNQHVPANVLAIWADVFVSADCALKDARIALRAHAGADTSEMEVNLTVPDIAYPETGAITCDLNNYADSISNLYPSLMSNEAKYRDGSYVRVEQKYYQMAREHRSLFHNLPYRHSGKIQESFAPVLEGEGKDIRVKDWSLFDAHFGALLDGSAFKGSRVSEKPLEYMYLPFHLGWPASYEKWDQKGYKTEYRRILAEFIRHFEEKGWYTTKLELFLNHKKDYRFFPYTADEIWYLHDEESMDKWYDVIQGAYEHTRVPFIPRIDSSNYFGIHHNNHRYADWFKLWVAGVSMFNWYPESVAAFREHGNTLWIYGSVLKDMRTSLLSLYQWPITCLMTGADGFCVWNTTGAGDAPLKTPRDNGAELLFYPGEAFGVDGPLGCIRLKTLRNAMQLCELAADMDKRRVHAFVNNLFELSGDDAWWREKPAFIDTPPRYWDYGPDFEKTTVKQLYLGRSPEMAARFREGLLTLDQKDAPKAASKGFRYF